MRVLAIAHGLNQLAGIGLPLREILAQRAREPSRNRRVIARCARIGPRRQVLAQSKVGAAVNLHGRQHPLHVGDVGADTDVGVVLGGRADHRRPSDVDVLDTFVEGRALGGGRLERIEVHIDQIDAADPVLLHRRRMLGRVAVGEDAAVDDGVQRLDPPVHHLGKAGEVRHIFHRQAGVGDRLAGAAGRDQLDAKANQRGGRLNQAGLVGHGNQRALDGNAVGGRGK